MQKRCLQSRYGKIASQLPKFSDAASVAMLVRYKVLSRLQCLATNEVQKNGLVKDGQHSFYYNLCHCLQYKWSTSELRGETFRRAVAYMVCTGFKLKAGVVPNSAPCQIRHPLVLVGLGVGVGEGLGLGNQVAISMRGCIIWQGCRFRHTRRPERHS